MIIAAIASKKVYGFITKFWVIFAFVLTSSFVDAATYKIIATEGQRTQADMSKPHHKKYRAKIELQVDGEQVLTVWGSTLPDNQHSYVAHDYKPNQFIDDKTLLELVDPTSPDQETYLEKITEGVFVGDLTLDNHKQDLDYFFEHYPVLPSGTYYFDVGFHKDGSSALGYPYALRLRGTPDKSGFDGTTNTPNDNLMGGGYVRSLNFNKKHDAYVANGVNIHRGNLGSDFRRSTGCITIDPDDWEKFIMKFPFEPEDLRRYREEHFTYEFANYAAAVKLAKEINNEPWNFSFDQPTVNWNDYVSLMKARMPLGGNQWDIGKHIGVLVIQRATRGPASDENSSPALPPENLAVEIIE